MTLNFPVVIQDLIRDRTNQIVIVIKEIAGLARNDIKREISNARYQLNKSPFPGS